MSLKVVKLDLIIRLNAGIFAWIGCLDEFDQIIKQYAQVDFFIAISLKTFVDKFNN